MALHYPALKGFHLHLLLVASVLPVLSFPPTSALQREYRRDHQDSPDPRYTAFLQRRNLQVVPANTLQPLSEDAYPGPWSTVEGRLLADKRTEELEELLQKIHDSVLTVGKGRQQWQQQQRMQQTAPSNSRPTNSFLRIGRSDDKGQQWRSVLGQRGAQPLPASVQDQRDKKWSVWRGEAGGSGGGSYNPGTRQSLSWVSGTSRQGLRHARAQSPRNRFLRFGRSGFSRNSLTRTSRSASANTTKLAVHRRFNSFARIGKGVGADSSKLTLRRRSNSFVRIGRGVSANYSEPPVRRRSNSFVRIGKGVNASDTKLSVNRRLNSFVRIGKSASSNDTKLAVNRRLNSFVRIGRQPLGRGMGRAGRSSSLPSVLRIERKPLGHGGESAARRDSAHSSPRAAHVEERAHRARHYTFLRNGKAPLSHPASGSPASRNTGQGQGPHPAVPATPSVHSTDFRPPARAPVLTRARRQSEAASDYEERAKLLNQMLSMGRRSFLRIGRLPSSAFLLLRNGGRPPGGSLAARRSPGYRLSQAGFVRMGRT